MSIESQPYCRRSGDGSFTVCKDTIETHIPASIAARSEILQGDLVPYAADEALPVLSNLQSWEANFLIDRESLKEISAELGRRSFEPEAELSCMEVLETLTDDLVRVVLQTSANSLQHHLMMLPISVHSLAINVAMPQILAKKQLVLDIGSLSAANAMKVMQELTQQPDVRTLHLINVPSFGGVSHFNSEVCSILTRHSLTDVSFCLEMATSDTNETVRDLLHALAGSTNLKSLHMEHPEPAPSFGVQSIEVKSLFALADQICGQLSLACLPRMQELSLLWGMGRFELDNSRQNSLCSMLRQHTDLTSLQLDCGVGRTSVLAGVLDKLTELRHLNLSLYMHAAKRRHARTDLEPFVSALAGLTALSRLALTVSHAEEDSSPLEIASALLSLHAMQHLDFAGFQMTRKDLPELSQALELMHGLQSFSVRVAALDEAAVQVLVSLSVSSSSSCTSLRFAADEPCMQMLGSNVKRVVPRDPEVFLKSVARAATQLPGALAQLSSLQKLSLHNCTFADNTLLQKLLYAAEAHEDMSAAYKQMCCGVLRKARDQFDRDVQSDAHPNSSLYEGLRCLTKLSQLTSLILSASSMHTKPLDFDFHPMHGFTTLTAQQLTQIQDLAVLGASVKQQGSLAWLSRFPLQSLLLCECVCSLERGVSDIIGTHDLELLSRVTTLTSLDLKLSGSCYVFHWEDLASLVQLRELRISSADLVGPDCEAFARCLGSMRDLMSLKLCGCHIKSDRAYSFSRLAKGLSTVPQITSLDFSESIFRGYIDELASTVGSLRFLRSLGLNKCVFTCSKDASVMLGCLQPHQQIEFVDFRRQDGSADNWDAVIWLLGTVPSLRRLIVDFIPETLTHERAEAILALISDDDPTRCALLQELCRLRLSLLGPGNAAMATFP